MKPCEKAREEASYSIAYIASQTHLQAETIQALEQEQFEQLPGEVFIRGYIRTYTKLLGLQAQPLIDAYENTKTGCHRTNDNGNSTEKTTFNRCRSNCDLEYGYSCDNLSRFA